MSQRFLLTISCVLLCSACSRQDQQLEIPFVAEYNGTPIRCEEIASRPVLSDLRFYVSELAVTDREGDAVHVEMVADGVWQQPDLALVDLENGIESCANGTGDTNSTLRVRVSESDFRGLQFTVGVPFDRNHGDPLGAAAPLGDAAMHWHWRSGYKFLRAGIRTANDGFWIHVGSTACQGTVRNISGCDRPNRITISLPDFELGTDTIVVDLAGLVAGTNLSDGSPGDCSSGPAEAACEAPFKALGIDFSTGSRAGEQRVFKRQAGR